EHQLFMSSPGAPFSIRNRRPAISAVASAALVLFVPGAARACSVCFGNSDSKLTEGMLAGVLVLLFVVLSVLGGFVALFICLARRAAAAAALENQSIESKVNS